MAKTYKVNLATRMSNSLLMTMLRAGVNMRTMLLLTVRGRKSGHPHSVPVTLIVQDNQRWLVAPYGVVQWVATSGQQERQRSPVVVVLRRSR